MATADCEYDCSLWKADALKSRMEVAATDVEECRRVVLELRESRNRENELLAKTQELQRTLDEHDERADERGREAEYLDSLRRQIEEGMPDLHAIEVLLFALMRASFSIHSLACADRCFTHPNNRTDSQVS